MLEQLYEYDRSLFLFLNRLSGDSLDTFWVVTTQIYTWIPLFLFMLYLVFKHYNTKQAVQITVAVLLTLLFTLLFTELVKEWFARIRPNNETTFNTLIKILQTPGDYSFFSGHASNSFAVSTIFYLVLRHKVKYLKFIFLWPVLFCLSRIFVGVHYPSDILVGSVTGVFIGIVFHRFLKYIMK